ncbi:MAG: hypothetical protein JJU40_12490, partial [Rhodobacteraceae bacterium]|nr:hypothetical protein [Paracoccaceae bacterium]
ALLDDVHAVAARDDKRRRHGMRARIRETMQMAALIAHAGCQVMSLFHPLSRSEMRLRRMRRAGDRQVFYPEILPDCNP